MQIEEILPLLNSGGIVVLLLFAIKLGINGQVVSRSMVREIVRQTLDELRRDQANATVLDSPKSEVNAG